MLRILWSNDNPERGFWGCKSYKVCRKVNFNIILSNLFYVSSFVTDFPPLCTVEWANLLQFFE